MTTILAEEDSVKRTRIGVSRRVSAMQPSSLIPSQRRERSFLNGLIRRTKKPPACAGGFVPFGKQMLSADRDTSLQIRWTNNRQRSLGHDQFDPEGISALEIRRPVLLSQCVHAVLFRSEGCFGETRQLK